MLTPEYLDGIAEPIQAIYSELETLVMRDIARRIAGADYVMTPSAEWQIKKLNEIGASQAYIMQEVARIMKISEKEVYAIFEAAGIKSMQTDIDLQQAIIDTGKLSGDVIPLNANPMIKQILTADALRTVNTMKKLTRTIATDASGKLNQYLDQAQLMVQSGAFTKEKAIEVSVTALARDGLNTIDYASGAKISVEAGVRRAVVTGVNQATCKISEANADALDTDLVEVTSHADARPSHAEWQGKVYSRSGKSEKYRSLKEATGYGEASGLCGVNCRHSFYAYVDGISETLPREKYDPKTYEAEQIQRYNERQIREWKKRAAVLDAGGVDSSNAKARIAYWQARQRKHLEKAGLTREYSREKVYKGVANSSEEDIIKLDAKAEDSISRKDFSDIEQLKGKLSNRAARKWYIYHDKQIPSMIDKTKPVEEQARQACELRNTHRTQARDLMRDQEMRKKLDQAEPNKAFDDLLHEKMERDGITKEDAYRRILESATRTRKSVNKSLGLE